MALKDPGGEYILKKPNTALVMKILCFFFHFKLENDLQAFDDLKSDHKDFMTSCSACKLLFIYQKPKLFPDSSW